MFVAFAIVVVNDVVIALTYVVAAAADVNVLVVFIIAIAVLCNWVFK